MSLFFVNRWSVFIPNRKPGIRFYRIGIVIPCVLVLFSLSACRESSPNEPEQVNNSLTISVTTPNVISGSSVQLTATLIGDDGTAKDVTAQATWSVSPSSAGEVNLNGLFKVFQNQIGIVTIQADYKSEKASTDIQIDPRAVAFAISPAMPNLEAGVELRLKVFASWEDGTEAIVSTGISWQVTPGVAAEIDAEGLLRTIPGMTGSETVSAIFQVYSSTSEVNIQAVYLERFEMINIDAGKFIMGDNSDSAYSRSGTVHDQRPEHEVFLDAYALGKYEITNAQYVVFLNSALAREDILVDAGQVKKKKPPHRFMFITRVNDFPQDPAVPVYIRFNESSEVSQFEVVPGFENHPVIQLTWFGAEEFCRFYDLRLPTEAEWERAARADRRLEYGTTDGTLSHDLANYYGTDGQDTYEFVAPVGSFPANPWGFHDLCGNALEYAFDFYDETYYQNSPTKNPTGPGPVLETGIPDPNLWYVTRGGSWLSGATTPFYKLFVFDEFWLRSGFRGTKHQANEEDPTAAGGVQVGVRVARSLP